jgi:uncharacterized protein with von Willebrand factor type A (vWA) domain
MGLLLNVDYSDPLARARAWKILRSVGSNVVGEEEAIDAYYLHYRVPIFGGRVSSPVWKRFVQLYSTPRTTTKLRRSVGLDTALSTRRRSLLRAFVDYLKSLEEFGRAWFGRGRRDAWVEALRH